MTAGTGYAGLQLAEHVRAAESDGQVILLDLKRNRYLGLAPAQASALAGQVAGWPCATAAGAVPSSTAATLTRRLIHQGLLTDSNSHRAAPPQMQEAIASADAPEDFQPGAVCARRTFHFLASAALTAWWLRCNSLHTIALKVAARHDRVKGQAAQPLDVHREATACYERLRPLVFTARDRCLHDSLTLVTFLAAEGLHARWVVGVKTRPFGAHAWVQSGHTVLGDQHDYVRAFRPILVV
jgi:hypothetical protein